MVHELYAYYMKSIDMYYIVRVVYDTVRVA